MVPIGAWDAVNKLAAFIFMVVGNEAIIKKLFENSAVFQ
jgi:hypothetical protein